MAIVVESVGESRPRQAQGESGDFPEWVIWVAAKVFSLLARLSTGTAVVGPRG